MGHVLAMFDQIRVINLVDRPDRKREMMEQIDRVGGAAMNLAFYPAHRPFDAGDFPSLGARGCFESHLNVLRGARDSNAKSLLLLEDDFDFTRDGPLRTEATLKDLAASDWDFFYGAHLLPAHGRRNLAVIPPEESVVTASFLAFQGHVIAPLVDFLEGLLGRPAGSPDYGPMHVDGAYGIFREQHPELKTFGAFPVLGKQRSSRSDITPTDMLLDRWTGTRSLANMLRRGYNRITHK